jgi:peptidoglycan hydrolase-like protein with peptidoglycan-binding domain
MSEENTEKSTPAKKGAGSAGAASKAAATPAPKSLRGTESLPAVVGTGDVDEVSVSAIVYRNLYAKKSLSVHHLQRRLNEIGYSSAYSDVDGYFADGTREALAQFAQDEGLDYVEPLPYALVEAIFEGDDNVRVVA